MKALLVANWKMHLYPAQAEALLMEIKRLESAEGPWSFPVVLCPPHIYLAMALQLLAETTFKVGAQNGYPGESGAYTGEISMAQLKAIGCTHVIVGHSERRQYFGEKGALLRAKVQDAQARGLTVIYCVGETIAQREAGATYAILEDQLQEALEGRELLWDRLVVAYEPVWAIGTGHNATPEQAQEAHAFIRGWLRQTSTSASEIPILYGGSIKPSNAEALFRQPEVNGGLVGGAGLVAADFWAIAAALEKAKGTPT